MGAFVLGVLIGWLVEWLFYTFWVKAGDNQGDCSAIKAELELKNRQITSLQSQLASATESSDVNSNLTTKKVSSKTKDNKSAKQAITGGSSKTTSSNKKPTSKTGAKNQAAATSKPKKIVASNTSTKKQKPRATGDDFTKLSGIGPSMSATLKSLGIDTFKKLADSDDDILRSMIESSGAKMNNNKEAMDSWNEQATLADKGDFAGLKKMQEELKK